LLNTDGEEELLGIGIALLRDQLHLLDRRVVITLRHLLGVDPRGVLHIGEVNANLDSHHLATFPCSIISDRKSTRLNSSHVSISYAVFCLKKKKKLIMY